MELEQKAAPQPEMWLSKTGCSKQLKLFTSPTWICLSVDLQKDSLISHCTGEGGCVTGRVWSSVSKACRVYALTVLMIVSFYMKLQVLIFYSSRLMSLLQRFQWTEDQRPDTEANLDVLSLAETQAASVLLLHFCQNAQFSSADQKQCYSMRKQLIINSPCCGKGKLSIEQSTRPENVIITNTKPLPSLKVQRQNEMQYVLPCGPYSRGKQANMYLQQRITLQQNPPFAPLKCTRTNLCFQHNSVISQFKINSCLKNIRLKTSPALAFTFSTSWKFKHCDRQHFLVAQICTGMQGIFYINTE